MYRNQKICYVEIRAHLATQFSRAKNLGGHFGPNENGLQIGVYCIKKKRPARPHGFNEANDKLIRVHGAEISYKTYVNYPYQTKLSNHVLYDISAPRTRINFVFASLKPCGLAGRC